MTRYSAWRFIAPQPLWQQATHEAFTNWGLKLTVQKGVSLIAEEGSVRQAILLLLLTRQGERLMRPDYGSELHKLVFAPNNDATANIALHHVRTALTKYEPRVTIVSLNADRNPRHPNILLLSLTYQIRTSGDIEQVNISLDLTGDTQ